MYRGIGAAALSVLAIAVVMAGCGGQSNSSTDSTAASGSATSAATTTAASLTKAEFVKQANAVCKAGSDQIHSGAEAFKEKQGIEAEASLDSAQEEALVTDVVVPSIQAQAEGVAKLGAPKGDQAKVDAIVKGLEATAKAGEKKPGSILKEFPGNPISEVNKAAEAYGVEECKQP